VEEVARAVLDALDLGVVALTQDLEREIYRNAAAERLLGGALPAQLFEMISGYVDSRRDLRRMPPPVRITLGERTVYLRVTRGEGPPPVEIVLLNEEVLRDADAFRLLNARHGVTRREYQVLARIRQGKTNRQIAEELELSEATIQLHVHHLLGRFDVVNRTGLVAVIDELLRKRA
jgi:DNA-binding CsgD family transcriptional regulator